MPAVTSSHENLSVHQSDPALSSIFRELLFESGFRESRSGLTENELRVFDAIRTYPSKNQKELSKMTGLSEGHVIKTVVKLRKMGLIERKGSRKAGYWSVDVTNSTAL